MSNSPAGSQRAVSNPSPTGEQAAGSAGPGSPGHGLTTKLGTITGGGASSMQEWLKATAEDLHVPEAADRIREFVRRHPLQAAAGSLAAGLVLGAFFGGRLASRSRKSESS